MKKIFLLTFHNAINYGTFLQAYALQQVLSTIVGRKNIKIINYYENSDEMTMIISKSIKKYKGSLIIIARKSIKYLKNILIKKKLHLTKKFTIKDLYINQFDTIIVGSDEVWNLNNANINNHEIFFGRGLMYNKIFAYAASFGSTEHFEDFQIKNDLEKFSRITVRDDNSRKILDSLGIKNSRSLDPTLLFDFKKEMITPLKNDYILFYGEPILDDSDIDIVLSIKNKYKKEVISIGPYQQWSSRNIQSASPFEFLGYINNSFAVITNTFHGTILSLKYNKPFYTFLMKHKINKIMDILNFLSISISPLNKDLIFPDWTSINRRIDNAKNDSLKYLREISTK